MPQGYLQVSLGRRSACLDIPSASSPHIFLGFYFALLLSLRILNGAVLHQCSTRANYLLKPRSDQPVSEFTPRNAPNVKSEEVLWGISFFMWYELMICRQHETTICCCDLALSISGSFPSGISCPGGNSLVCVSSFVGTSWYDRIDPAAQAVNAMTPLRQVALDR